MSEIRLTINGREVRGFEGQTILDIARENGVEIPTLCHDDRVAVYGSCGICVVEAEGSPRLLRSCSTMAAEGMAIRTDTERIRKSRKTALELLLSDHTGDCRPPCVLACPAGTDCQGYVGLIANGEFSEALKLVMDKIPLPGSIGKVCPHPCEEACRRQLVEEPISIAALKQFVADAGMEKGEVPTPEPAPDTGKKVAVIGGGPGGLTAAYFLRASGHAVTVFDAMPEMGGMLQYGIPEYRLSKKYLQTEIAAIRDMGVELRNNMRIGRDITLDSLRESCDAVVVAAGAWASTGLRCPGEELEGVVGGIDFLREVALGKAAYSPRRVAVVGGGNTAMDCARTAVRLGAEEVYNIYRRTKNEMPAEELEIDEAEEEGVIFKNLTNPIEVVGGGDGKVRGLRLQLMELGEPDGSGRRAPVAIPGAEENLAVDMVIVAIGQKPKLSGLEGIELTKWGTIAADERSFRTSLEGVFAVGDATNKGADIAISAIGEAKKAAAVVDKYLHGEDAPYTAPYLVKSEPGQEAFSHYEKRARAIKACRPPQERQNDFQEFSRGFDAATARREAERCLECGCLDYFECKLIACANQYDVEPRRLAGQRHNRVVKQDHPLISYNPDKCILCGLCVRICDEVTGATALGLVGRGFDATVKPALGLKLQETSCVSCGQCVSACPTGALAETMMIPKPLPVQEQTTETVCGFCGVGCKTKLTHTGNLILRSLPTADNQKDALLCMKGRFGFRELSMANRLTTPLLRQADGTYSAINFSEAYGQAVQNLKAIQARHGKDSIAFAVSDRNTNQEIAMIREMAREAFGTENVYSFSRPESGLAGVLGADISTADYTDLENAGLILLVGCDIQKPHFVAGIRVRRAAQNGGRIIALNGFDSAVDELAHRKLNPGSGLSLLKQILKAVTEISSSGKELPGYKEMAASLEGITISGEARAVAMEYVNTEKAVILFEENKLSPEAAQILGGIALCAGRANGIIRLKAGANGQGLADLGVKPGSELRRMLAEESVKGLFIFGEDVNDLPESLEFLGVQDLSLTATAQRAHLVLPARNFAETDGSFTNSVGDNQRLSAAVGSPVPVSNQEMLRGLFSAAGCDLPHEIPEATVKSTEYRLMPTCGDNFAQSVPCTNALYNSLITFAMKHSL